MSQPAMSLFVVERRLPRISEHQLEVLQAALTGAASRFTARGDGVRYLSSIFLARQERLLSLFTADSAETVRAVNEAALIPFASIEPAVELLNPDQLRLLSPRKDNSMTDVDTTTRATRTSVPSTLARAAVAMLLALAAPAVSFLPALTTNVHGSGAAVTFPHGYAVMFIVTVAVTVAACALGALIAGRAGRVAIPLGLALWAIIGFTIAIAGASLGQHAHLTEWGIALMAAALAGAAVGIPLASRR